MILRSLAGPETRPQYPGIGADRQGALVFTDAAGEDCEPARAVGLRKGLGAPTGVSPASSRHNPDLEDLCRLFLEVVFRMANPGAGTHHLDVAGLGAPLV